MFTETIGLCFVLFAPLLRRNQCSASLRYAGRSEVQLRGAELGDI